MSTTEVGVAYVRLLPSMDGFASAVKSELGDVLTRQARAAGEDAGKAMAKGIEDGASDADLDGFTSGIGDKLKLGLGAAGLAGGALLVEGLTSAMDLEATTDKLAAQLGDPEFGKAMGKIAGSLYADGFGESVADTSEALRKVWQNGLIPEDAADADIERVTTKLLTFSDVMEQDMDMATQAVSSMIKSGIADSSEEAFDVLTRGIQQGVDKSGDLLESFQEYSVQFEALGLDATEATGLMSQGLQAGARDADTVADALKEMAIRGKDGSKASAEGFALIGLSAEEMTAKFAKGGPAAKEALDQVIKGVQDLEDPVARDAAVVALFGTKSEDLQAALMGLDLETAAAGMGDVAGSTDELGSAYDNASSKIEAFKRGALMGLTEFIGGSVIPAVEWLIEKLGPPLQSALDAVSPYVTEIVDGFTTLKAAIDTGDDFGVGGWSDITGVMASVGVIIHDTLERAQPVINAFKTAWQEFSGYLEEHGEVVAGIVAGLAVAIGVALVGALVALVGSAVAAAAPFILIGVAVAAAGAGIAWLWENVEGFRTFVEEAAPAIGQVFSTAFTLISTVVSDTVANIRTIWGLWGDEIMSVTTAVLGVVGSVISNGLRIISGIFQLITALIRGDWGAAWDAIKQIATANLAIVQSVISGAMQVARAIISAAWTAIVGLFGGYMTTIKTTVSNGVNAVVNFFRNLPGQISSAMSTLANAITNPFRSAFNSLKSLWNSTVGGFGFSVPDWIPGVGGKGFKIPKMHGGGIFDAPAGGSEGLALLKRGEGVFTPDQIRALGATTPAAAAGATIVIEADDRRFKEWLRYTVRTEAGGSAEQWFGQN